MTRFQRFATVLLGLVTTPAAANGFDMDVPTLVEQAADAGIDHRYTGPWEYFVGGGAAAFDCNGDRLPDLAVAGGTEPAAIFVNRSATAGKLRFEEKADAIPEPVRERVTGFYPLDIDNDGVRDLVALRVGENVILKGGPDCTFEDASRAFAFDGGRAWTTAFAATFEPDLAFPSLAFGNYVDRSAPGSPWGTCHDNVLIRPSGTEGPDYSEQTVLTPGYCALSMLFTDWNRSGEPALRITNDRQYYREGEEQLWRVSPGRPPRPYRSSDGWRRVQIWGMGIAEADLDADGYPEYALTSMGDTKLQTLDDEADHDRPVYRDIAYDRNATAHRPYAGDDLKPSTGWHAEFSDFNNDGRLDLFIAKGNVEQMPDFAAYDPDNLLLGRYDGTFDEAGEAAGIALPRRGRGAAVADFNMDGMLDLAVVNRGEPLSLFRNTGGETASGTRPMGNWLQIELSQKGANRNAVGATILVKSGNETRTRKIQIGGGHASGSAGFVHVGTGVAERAEIRIQWPDGEWSAPFRVFANNFVVIEKGADEAMYWYPPGE
ncbi:FG-GAP repeat domain-containing protein [Oricola cellulosilytica]|uniref:VCBS repeat-containing protein n=1 Tax=Oricola cellulosilytica TaxID=1429082 RepID=A0A4R0PEH3_9HYPH|nr:VCBS repeat-containing protein [Oricola cellulosilytica]TCD14949.1 VCBS repeat-containing protein [Oricola cellulosilytica]